VLSTSGKDHPVAKVVLHLVREEPFLKGEPLERVLRQQPNLLRLRAGLHYIAPPLTLQSTAGTLPRVSTFYFFTRERIETREQKVLRTDA
jgi:hypothetical protein